MPHGFTAIQLVGRAANTLILGLVAASDLAHEREEIAFRVAEEPHPKIVVGQLGDEVRLAFKGHAAADERVARLLDGTRIVYRSGSPPQLYLCPDTRLLCIHT